MLSNFPTMGALIIGDEILSGRRTDKHPPKLIELLSARGLSLAYAYLWGDDPARITHLLKQAFESADVVFSFGGIGATPDDHTASVLPLRWGSPGIASASQDAHYPAHARSGRPTGAGFDPDHPDSLRRLTWACFPSMPASFPIPTTRSQVFPVQDQVVGVCILFPVSR